MAKQSAIEQDGTIVEALSNAMFRVQLENGHEITSQARCACTIYASFPATKCASRCRPTISPRGELLSAINKTSNTKRYESKSIR